VAGKAANAKTNATLPDFDFKSRFELAISNSPRSYSPVIYEYNAL
jgi:hypothetical protein